MLASVGIPHDHGPGSAETWRGSQPRAGDRGLAVAWPEASVRTPVSVGAWMTGAGGVAAPGSEMRWWISR